MNVATVAAELADKIDGITGLRVYPYPPDALAAPAAIIGYPDSIDFDMTWGRGVDSMTIPVYLVVDRNWDRATYTRIADFTAGTGSSSLKALLQTKPNVAYSTARVRSISHSVIAVAGLEYWVATFLVDITGPGE